VGLHKRRDFCGALLDRSFVACQRHRTANPGERIVSNDEVSENVFLLWGYRFFVLPNGRRQIFDFLLPGDLFSLTSISEERFGFPVDALTEVHITGSRRVEIKRRLALNFSLRLKWTIGVAREARTADELLVVLGQRTAKERIEYLMLRFTRRMSALGLADGNRHRLPVKQTHIADDLGITSE
jgi:CRP/FNR family transcriptional regulator